MRAAVFEEFGGPVDVRTVADPMPPAGGVVVEVHATGLCRSDWHAWAGHDDGVAVPHVPGHELVGVIAAVGAEVRRWTVGGRARHHVIDPRTGQPSDTDVDVMTIVAGEAWRAEVLATAGLLRGAARAFDLLDNATAGLAVTRLDEVICSPGLSPFLRRPAAA